MKKTLLALLLTVMAVAPSTAAAAAGRLDPSFGHHGRLTIPGPTEGYEPFPYAQKPAVASMAMDVLPAGGFAATNGSWVFVRSRDGRPSRRFGGDGKALVEPPADWRFELADLAADPQGRVLIAGTLVSLTWSPPLESPDYRNGARPRLGVIFRYLSNGELDRGFGEGGMLVSSFGQKPPPKAPGSKFEPVDPVVGLTGLALAPNGDIVVSGYAAASLTVGCNFGLAGGAIGRAFIARLTSEGNIDPSFGSGGVVTEPQLERPSPPALGPAGRIAFNGSSGYCWPRGPLATEKLLGLLGDGRFDPGFGADGGLPHPQLSSVDAVSFDAKGRLLVLGLWRPTELEPEFSEFVWRVRRLLADGAPDQSFGRNGSASPKLPPSAALEDLSVDGHGRIALAGYALNPSHEHPRFLLTRLSGEGHREPRFGRHGWMTTGFGVSAAGLQVVADRRDRLLVGGTIGHPWTGHRKGLAFARYLGR